MPQGFFRASSLASPNVSVMLLRGTSKRDQTLDAWLWGHRGVEGSLRPSLSLSLPSVHRGLGLHP